MVRNGTYHIMEFTIHENQGKLYVSKETVNTVKQDFYMDDVLKSTESGHEASTLVKGLKAVYNDGGFYLTQWSSNRREALQELAIEHQSKEFGFRFCSVDSRVIAWYFVESRRRCFSVSM